MAREVTTHIWCDVHLHEHDERVPGTEMPPITIGSMKPRVLALCEVCRKEVYDPIKELVTELGIIADATGAPPGMGRMPGTSPGSGIFPCPVEECKKHADPFKHEQSLRNHAREVHGLPIHELRAKLAEGGELDPDLFTPPQRAEPAIKEAPCDVPGCDVVYSYPKHQLPAQALGVHKAKKHGIRGPKSKPAKAAAKGASS